MENKRKLVNKLLQFKLNERPSREQAKQWLIGWLREHEFPTNGGIKPNMRA